MPTSNHPQTVNDYLALLPAERREAIEAVRGVILRNLPKGYAEGIQYGMIGYYVPHSVYAPGYHCDPKQPLPFAGLASQKNHMALYLMCVYGDPELGTWFREAWLATGKKLDMGKSCIRFKKLDDVPLKVIGQVIKRVPVKKLIERYESNLGRSSHRATKKKSTSKTRKPSERKTPGKKKASGKRTTARKATTKKRIG